MARTKQFEHAVRRTVIFDQSDFDLIKKHCADKGISFGDFVRTCALEELKRVMSESIATRYKPSKKKPLNIGSLDQP